MKGTLHSRFPTQVPTLNPGGGCFAESPEAGITLDQWRHQGSWGVTRTRPEYQPGFESYGGRWREPGGESLARFLFALHTLAHKDLCISLGASHLSAIQCGLWL